MQLYLTVKVTSVKLNKCFLCFHYLHNSWLYFALKWPQMKWNGHRLAFSASWAKYSEGKYSAIYNNENTHQSKVQHILMYNINSHKGNHTIADLRYGGENIISPSTLIFAPIKSLLGIYTHHMPSKVHYKLAMV